MKRLNNLFLISVVLIFTNCEKQEFIDDKDIRSVMDYQEDCWNKGNLEGFMEGYWTSDSLKFVSKNGITYGWANTLENYKKVYPTKEAMGTLDFEIVQLDTYSDHAVMIGKWTLKYSDNQKGGYFTLYWKYIKGKWVIVADHTS